MKRCEDADLLLWMKLSLDVNSSTGLICRHVGFELSPFSSALPSEKSICLVKSSIPFYLLRRWQSVEHACAAPKVAKSIFLAF